MSDPVNLEALRGQETEKPGVLSPRMRRSYRAWLNRPHPRSPDGEDYKQVEDAFASGWQARDKLVLRLIADADEEMGRADDARSDRASLISEIERLREIKESMAYRTSLIGRISAALELCELAIRTGNEIDVGGEKILGIHCDFRDEVLAKIWEAIGRPETRDPDLDRCCRRPQAPPRAPGGDAELRAGDPKCLDSGEQMTVMRLLAVADARCFPAHKARHDDDLRNAVSLIKRLSEALSAAPQPVGDVDGLVEDALRGRIGEILEMCLDITTTDPEPRVERAIEQIIEAATRLTRDREVIAAEYARGLEDAAERARVVIEAEGDPPQKARRIAKAIRALAATSAGR